VSAAQPPRFATFLMERIAGCGPILVGDLQEEYRAGRSQWWYWREALHVVAWSLVVGIRSHPIRFVRAIVALVIANNVAGVVAGAINLEFLEYLPPGWPYERYQLHLLAFIALSFPLCASATWSMARFHPEVRVPATLVVVVLLILNVIVGDAELRRLWGNMPEPRFVPYLLRHVLGILVWMAANLVGGMLVPVQFRASKKT
jgi:hypothetical protein